jgi:NADPH-dependent ferric siderophore reductase
VGAESRGWQGAVLRALRAPDYRLTVLDRTEVSPNYLRLRLAAGGLLADRSVHPTMWIRLWFPTGSGRQQRAYTVLRPDAANDTIELEFALHDGPAANWARTAAAGDEITATVMGSKFALPEPAPAGYLLVGDTASLPAINTLLPAVGDAPVRVYLGHQHDDDRELPVAATARTTLTWVPREQLVSRLAADAFDAAGHFGWVACDTRTTRAAVRVLRGDYRLDRHAIRSQAYWLP